MGIFSYQCSQLSTSESVIDVFDTASKFQCQQGTSSYVAVVVLDEVGLAEDSPNLPLKALHPLLEDGTEGAKKDYTDQVYIYVTFDYAATNKNCLFVFVCSTDKTSTRESCFHRHI